MAAVIVVVVVVVVMVVGDNMRFSPCSACGGYESRRHGQRLSSHEGERSAEAEQGVCVSVWVRLCLYVSVCLSLCPSVCLSVICVCVCVCA